MILRSVIFSLILFSALGCQPKQKMTIPEDKMVEILLDAHVLEASIKEVFVHEKDSINQVFHEQLFKIHQITPEIYWYNLELIQQDPQLTNRIYHRLQDSIMLRASQSDLEMKGEIEGNKEGDKKK